ncbi:unnamed protein product [Closterium sp. NIES-53]
MRARNTTSANIRRRTKQRRGRLQLRLGLDRRWTQEGRRRRTRRRRGAKNLLKERNEVRPRPRSASRNSRDRTGTLSPRVSSPSSTSSNTNTSTTSSSSSTSSSTSTSSSSSSTSSSSSSSSTSSTSSSSSTSSTSSSASTSSSSSSTSSTSSIPSTSSTSTSNNPTAPRLPLTKPLHGGHARGAPEHRGRGGRLCLGGRGRHGGRGRRAEVPVRLVSASRTPLPSRAALFRGIPGGPVWGRAAGAGGTAGAGGSVSAGGAGATSPRGARTGGTEAAERGGATSAGATGAAGAGGAAGVGTPGGTGAGAAESSGGPAGAGAAVSAGGTGAGGAAGGTGAGGAAGAGALVGAGVDTTGAAGGTARAGGIAGVGADAAGAVSAGSGGATRPRPYFFPLLEQLASPLPAPSPYTGPTGGLAERREPESRPALPVHTARTSRRVPCQRPPAVPSTHQMALRPSTASQRVPLPSPPASSLHALADPESDSLRAASPTITRFLATAVTDPSFESAPASALVAELVDFSAHCRLDYAASLIAESASVCPPSVGGECALSTDVLEDRQEEFQCFAAGLPHLVSTLLAPEGDPDAPDIPTPRSYAEAIEGPYSSQWQAAMDAEMASWKSTGTYVDEVPPPRANIVSGMWIFRGVDYFQTFSPTPKMTTLRVLLHIAAHRDYELHSLDFSTTFLQGSLHEEIWLRRPPGFTGSFPAGTQWSLRRPVYGLRQAPREWHDTLRTTLAALGFAPSTTDPSLFLRTDTLLPPFYILVYVDDLVFAMADTAGLATVKSELQKRHTCTDLGELRSYLGLQITRDRARRTITLTQSHMVQQVLQRFNFTYSSPQATPLSTHHSLSALPSDESVEPSGLYPELVGCLMYLMTCTRPDLAYPLSILARYVAHGRHRPEHMAAANRVLRYLCSTSGMGLVLGGRSPVVLTGYADASWVYNLAMQRSSQGYTFSLDNKAMLALCREHRLEHRTKHIALRYFLARELQQRRQLRLAYVASLANTADIFTKALQPCDHQRFCTMLACFALLCLIGLVTPCSPPLCLWGGWQEGVLPTHVPCSRTRSSAPAPLPPLSPLHGDRGERV